MVNSLLRLLVLSLFYTLFYSCANQVAPTGGEKDEEPPKLVESTPSNYSTGFTGKKIMITFDEYVSITDVFNQVVISPPVDEMPDFKLRGKSLVVSFKDSLRENTTYTLNFGESIKDITQDNIAQNFQFVWSTGPQLDSLKVTGNVKHAVDNKPAEGVWVILYKELGDSVPYKNKPYYFARTDESGAYSLSNLRAGEYKLFALLDKDFNYQYNLPNESIAYHDEPIIVEDSVRNYALRLFQEDQGKQQLLEVDTSTTGLVKLVYAKSHTAMQIKELSGDYMGYCFEPNIEGDTINFWYWQNQEEEMKVVFRAKEVTDTVRFQSPVFDNDSALNYLKPLSITLRPNVIDSKGVLELNEPIRIWSSRPIKPDLGPSILLYEDSVLTTASPVSDGRETRSMTLEYDWKEGSTYQLAIPKGAIKDHYDLTHDSLTLHYTTKRLEDYGTLAINVQGLDPGKYYRLFLRSEKGKVVYDEIIEGGNSFQEQYKYLQPGKYSLQVVDDINRNGKWDTGNYLENKQPELVHDSEELIDLRANWDMEFEMNISD